MARLLHRILEKKPLKNFQKADYTEITTDLQNPARGWYQIYTFYAEEKPQFEALHWCKKSTDTLALVIINIGAYRECDITDEALAHIQEILDFFSQMKKEIILRIVYDHEGKAIEREPYLFGQVKAHLHQLIPVINRYRDSIFVLQGMLIGNWGEMHTSRFLETRRLREMWYIYEEQLDKNIYLAVRRPVYWRLMHQDGDKYSAPVPDNMSLFDDAIFGSDTHLGTYGTKSLRDANWEEQWSRQDELDFIDTLCAFVPNGGEALCGKDYLQNATPESTIDRLRKMHITYLNKAYDEQIISLWKQWQWQEEAFYDYLGRYLGYRFVIRNAEIYKSDDSDREVEFRCVIANVGFADFYQQSEIWLKRIDAQGKIYKEKLSSELKDIRSGAERTITCSLGAIDCKFYLYAKRVTDGRTIYFANHSNADGEVLLGELHM